MDLDRITFAAAFRRLKDKTQVHALPDNDHVRNRLTHSIETASVGRSLGVQVGQEIGKRHPHLRAEYAAPYFGHVVQAACLAHDIGNPPFGHAGESAIQTWFAQRRQEAWFAALNPPQQADLLQFEGNAQGFRLLTQLEMGRRKGGLRLTHGVLGAFTKYPRPALAQVNAAERWDAGAKRKNGFFQSEQTQMAEVAESCGMITADADAPRWRRHPLAYLMEAADDITYGVIDLEDGVELGLIPPWEAITVLTEIAQPKFDMKGGPLERVRTLRAMAMGQLNEAAAQTFVDHESELLAGQFHGGLMDASPLAEPLRAAGQLARDRLYMAEPVALKVAAGQRVIQGLLEIFQPVVIALHAAQWETAALDSQHRYLAALLDAETLTTLRGAPTVNSYEALLFLTDFLSGMSDKQALRLYRRLNGIDV
ncbi:putative deoxyguanosinetriphosphate triphosphohydrolase [Magnetofaba australis IT-1]|uniref:Putative deoxyguanosinetriphosphate triphosphohydrolase n=1 Tax=Magnetofaba australis IT-1 TaxID=1434232 RepID=A0A1Y2K275_9PROT|nr:putative deoxyguanosinetriphosphate triphosphohydrolase [Magnetofaba australis IT-1]